MRVVPSAPPTSTTRSWVTPTGTVIVWSTVRHVPAEVAANGVVRLDSTAPVAESCCTNHEPPGPALTLREPSLPPCE
jgi:hypothetical protein